MYHLLFRKFSDKKYMFPFKFPKILYRKDLRKNFPELNSKLKYGVVY